MGLNISLPDVSKASGQITEGLVKLGAIYAIASMEYQLIVTGQDGVLLLPTAFIIGLIAGVKASDIKNCINKK